MMCRPQHVLFAVWTIQIEFFRSMWRSRLWILRDQFRTICVCICILFLYLRVCWGKPRCLLDLCESDPFWNIVLVKNSSGWTLQWSVPNQIWRTVSSSSFQLYLKKKTLSHNFQLSPSRSGQSQGYVGRLKFELIGLLMVWGIVE